MRSMKYLFTAIALFFGIGFSKNKTSADEQKKLDATSGVKLVEANYLRFADTLNIDYVRSQVNDYFNIYQEGINKFVHIDAEELAEFQFNSIIKQLNSILKKRSFSLNIDKTVDYKNTHEILINGETIQLYTKNDLENGEFWDVASRSFFRKVNQLLKKENQIDESFYLVYGGNDLHVFLLTELINEAKLKHRILATYNSAYMP
jgi:hypothetical protein